MGSKKAKTDRGDAANDVFERMPDSLVLKVFSKLPHVGHVLRAASVCQRFRALASQVEKLVVDFNRFPDTESWIRHEMGVGLLLARSAKGALKDVTFMAASRSSFTQMSVLSWIIAVSPSITLLKVEDEDSRDDLGRRLEAASHCSRLARFYHTGSSDCIMTSEVISSCRGGFRRLEVLNLQNLSTTSETVTQLVSLCPRLRKLYLEGLQGVEQLELSNSTIEYVRLNATTDWGEDLGSLRDVTLVMPALESLSLGDLGDSLTLRDAPLETLELFEPLNHAAIDLGSEADLESLEIHMDSWPPSGNVFARSFAFSRILFILKQSMPGSLRTLTMPSIDIFERLSWTQAQDFFKLIVRLRVFNFMGSFAVACGFGESVSESEGIAAQLRGLVQELNFKDLLDVSFYLNVETPACFELMEIMAKRSPALRSLTVYTDSGVVGFELPGSFISEVVRFQRSYPQVKVDIKLPHVLRCY